MNAKTCSPTEPLRRRLVVAPHWRPRSLASERSACGRNKPIMNESMVERNALGAAAHQGELPGDAVTIQSLTRRYGEHEGLNGLVLDVEPGQFVAIVGRSSCCTSALLRLSAGHEARAQAAWDFPLAQSRRRPRSASCSRRPACCCGNGAFRTRGTPPTPTRSIRWAWANARWRLVACAVGRSVVAGAAGARARP